jgi:hypothetical protein
MIEVFSECMLTRTKKSMEHLKRFIEIFYVEIIEPWFVSGPQAAENQVTLVKTVARAWRERNPFRCIQIIEKLWSLGVLGGQHVINWALKSLKEGSVDEIEI